MEEDAPMEPQPEEETQILQIPIDQPPEEEGWKEEIWWNIELWISS